MDFSEQQLQRYSRHILLDEIGGLGQEKLLAARVLVIGAGGLGSPLLAYLAAAGVGGLGVVDDDRVELSNLQRQILHDQSSLGRYKTDSARDRLQALNEDVQVTLHPERLTEANAETLIGAYDLVADGSDNFATRFLVGDTCYRLGKTLVSAAVLRFEGQLVTFKPQRGGPCYRCLWPSPPPPGQIPSCSEAGVLGATVGVMGSLQATEVIKAILGLDTTEASGNANGWNGNGSGQNGSGQNGSGQNGSDKESPMSRLTLYDALGGSFRTVRIRRNPACVQCGV